MFLGFRGYTPSPRDPWVPKVCKYYLHWAIWILRARASELGFRAVEFGSCLRFRAWAFRISASGTEM